MFKKLCIVLGVSSVCCIVAGGLLLAPAVNDLFLEHGTRVYSRAYVAVEGFLLLYGFVGFFAALVCAAFVKA